VTTERPIAAPTPGDDPERYVIEAADWLSTLDPDDDGIPYPLLLVAQRLALVALDRQRRIIDLSNRLAVLDHERATARLLTRDEHPAGIGLRSVIVGGHG
jgi:hypothetical protein